VGLIRFYLALAVVVWHLSPGDTSPMLAGNFAVLLFYMISGFYMSMVINKTYAKLPKYRFYVSRALRLFPVYFAVLLPSACLLFVYHTPNFIRDWESPIGLSDWMKVIFSNLTFLGLDTLPSNQRLISVAWTLGIEVQFYLVAPFIVSRRIRVCIAILAAALGLRFYLLWIHHDVYEYAPAVWCFFLIGQVCHRISANLNERFLQRAGSVALLLLPFFGYLCGLPNRELPFPGLDRVQFWIFYLGFALCIPAFFAAFKSSRVDRFLGELSYPMYISHLLVVGLAGKFLYLPFSPEALSAAIVVFVSVILYLVVQRPIDSIRHLNLLRRPANLVKLSV
jgi:peptidoglycan/LPS O-acetylase OafA/YrhL